MTLEVFLTLGVVALFFVAVRISHDDGYRQGKKQEPLSWIPRSDEVHHISKGDEHCVVMSLAYWRRMTIRTR
jgi:hypothetical protein